MNLTFSRGAFPVSVSSVNEHKVSCCYVTCRCSADSAGMWGRLCCFLTRSAWYKVNTAAVHINITLTFSCYSFLDSQSAVTLFSSVLFLFISTCPALSLCRFLSLSLYLWEKKTNCVNCQTSTHVTVKSVKYQRRPSDHTSSLSSGLLLTFTSCHPSGGCRHGGLMPNSPPPL